MRSKRFLVTEPRSSKRAYFPCPNAYTYAPKKTLYRYSETYPETHHTNGQCQSSSPQYVNSFCTNTPPSSKGSPKRKTDSWKSSYETT